MVIRFDQLFDDESDPFEVLKAAENKTKEASGGGIGDPWAKSVAQAAAQTNSSAAGKQLRLHEIHVSLCPCHLAS